MIIRRHFLTLEKIRVIQFSTAKKSKHHSVKEQASSQGWLITSNLYSEISMRGLFLLFHKDCLIAQGYNPEAS